MTDQPAPKPVGAPKKAASVGGQAVGIVGIVISLLLALGVIVGRGWLVDQVNGVAGAVDDGLAKGVPLLADADAKVTDVQARITEAGDAARAVLDGSSPPPAVVQAFSARLSAVTDRYFPLRASYADARANVVSTIDRLQTLDRLVPGISVPEGPVDALATLDGTVRAVDSNVMAVLSANEGAQAVADAARTVAAKAPDVTAALDGVHGKIADAQARLTATRDSLASAASSITTAITIVALVIVLGLLYVAFLHLVLFRSAGGVRKPKA